MEPIDKKGGLPHRGSEEVPGSSTLTKTSSVATLALSATPAVGAGTAAIPPATSIPTDSVTSYPIGLTIEECEPFLDAAVKTCTEDFVKANPKGPEPSPENVFAWLTNPTRRENNEKPRIEIRQCIGSPIIANVALSLANSETRDGVFDSLSGTRETDRLHFVKAGSTTIEISSPGVSKATPIAFLRVPGVFESILEKIGYTPGPQIDARIHRTAVISDADGTLWDKPESGKPVESTNLFNSKAREPILRYLLSGGVLVVNTGNDPARTLRRFIVGFAGLSAAELKMVKSRVIFASAGGGSLCGYQDGRITEFEEYHSFPPERKYVGDMDMLYLGDDAKEKGNDMPGFIASKDHFICVAPESSTAHVEASKIPHRVQYGEVDSVHAIFTAISRQARVNSLALRAPSPKRLFGDMEALLANTRNTRPAMEVTGETLARLGGRSEIQARIASSDAMNAPVKIEHKDASEAASVAPFIPPEKKGSLFLYADVAAAYGSRQAASPPPTTRTITGSAAGAGRSVEDEATAVIKAFLDESGLAASTEKSVQTLRILIPGNNDQATPMYTAFQIKRLQEELVLIGGNPDNLRIEVLVMGMGGHATTAMYPQIGQMREGDFTGTPEAISLGETLERALFENGVGSTTVDEFNPEALGVQIKLAKDSRNTGENVKEAREAYETSRPDFQWVVAARTSSLRQGLTFAHQYETEAGKCYDTLWSLSPPRSERFISESLSDHQLMTELYGSMAEKTRLLFYALPQGHYKPPYIPPFTADQTELMSLLDEVYEVYERLNNLPPGSAKAAVSLQELLQFYMQQFSFFEGAIPWNKEQETQQAYTLQAMQELKGRGVHTAILSALEILDENLARVDASEELQPALGKLLAYLKTPPSERKDSDSLLAICREVNRLHRKTVS